jgi:hypothetical protein
VAPEDPCNCTFFVQSPRTGLPKGGIACAAGRIIGVDFLFSNSFHTNVPDQNFPEAVLGMGALEYLDLGSNGIGSSIPPGIGELTDLVYLDFEDNRLTGDLPNDALAKLTKLTALSVGQNPQLTGSFPGAALLKMTSLTALAFDDDGDFVPGLLPALPFEQYSTYCALYNIPFSCPLPPGSELCINNGQGTPPSCRGPPVPVPTPYPTPVPPTPAPSPPTPAPPTPVMFSCNSATGRCAADPQGTLAPGECIATCKIVPPTPPPTPVMYSCNSATGRCAADPQGTQAPGECIATCKIVPPTPAPAPPPSSHECDPAKTCNVCAACCHSFIPDGATCDACATKNCAATAV